MKKLFLFTNVIIILLVSLSTLIALEHIDKDKYYPEHDYGSINYIILSNIIKSNQDLEALNAIVERNNVVLMVKEPIDKIELYKLDNRAYNKMTKTLNVSDDSEGISTVPMTGFKHVKDFMGNDYFAYLKLDLEAIKDNNIIVMSNSEYPTGELVDFQHFVGDVSEAFNIDRNDFVRDNAARVANNTSRIFSVLTGILVVLSLIIVATSFLFFFFNRSKKIGILMMLGYHTRTIFIEQMKPFIKVMIVCVLAIGGMLLLVANTPLSIFLTFTLIILGFLVLINIIIYIILNLIVQKIHIGLLVKDKRVTKSYLMTAQTIKIMLTVVVMLITMMAVDYGIFTIETILKNSHFSDVDKSLVISGFYVSPESPFVQFTYEQSMAFGTELYNRLDEQYDVSGISLNPELYSNLFTYGRSDYYHINKIGLTDDNGDKIVISQLPPSRTVLVPISLKDKSLSIESVLSELTSKQQPFRYIYYEDTCIETYDFEIPSCVQNPVIEVAGQDANFSLQTYGRGISTPIKIHSDDIQGVYDIVKEVTEKYGLYDFITKDNIRSVGYLKSQEIANVTYGALAIVGVGLLGILLLIIVSNQCNRLYLMYHQKEISVKKLLGYKDDVIFGNRIIRLIMMDFIVLLLISFISLIFFSTETVVSGFVVLMVLVIMHTYLYNYYYLNKKSQILVKEKLRGD